MRCLINASILYQAFTIRIQKKRHLQATSKDFKRAPCYNDLSKLRVSVAFRHTNKEINYKKVLTMMDKSRNFSHLSRKAKCYTTLENILAKTIANELRNITFQKITLRNPFYQPSPLSMCLILSLIPLQEGSMAMSKNIDLNLKEI